MSLHVTALAQIWPVATMLREHLHSQGLTCRPLTCSPATVAEVSSCDRDHVACKAQNTHCPALNGNGQPTFPWDQYLACREPSINVNRKRSHGPHARLCLPCCLLPVFL